MRLASKLVLLAASALAVMAIGASSASANPVEVVDEATLAHCGTVATCDVHVLGNTSLQIPNGPVVSACESEFDVRFNEDGSGVVSNVNFHENPGVCNSIPCTGDEGTWPVSSMEETAANEVGSEVEFCLLSTAGEQHCTVPIHIEEDPADPHHYIVSIASSHDGPPGQFQCPSGLLVGGTLETESNPHTELGEVEIQHTEG